MSEVNGAGSVVAEDANCCDSCQLDSVLGCSLHCTYWRPKKEPRALVMMVHGLAEHLECYAELGSRLAKQGFLAFGHDHVGHGRSEGNRIHIDSVDDYVSDVLHHIQTMKEKYPSLPVFAVGHSMGGMITLCAALRSPTTFEGVVLMGPLIHMDPTLASPFRIWIARWVCRIAPNLPVATLDLKYVTRDEEKQQMMVNDHLRYHGGVKCKWAVATHEALVELNSKLQEMQVPFLILHGEKDKLCNVEGSRALYSKAAVKDKQLKVFTDAAHHLYLELLQVREEALSDTIQWICQRVSSD